MIVVAVHAIDVKDVNIAEPWPNVNIRIKEKEMLEPFSVTFSEERRRKIN